MGNNTVNTDVSIWQILFPAGSTVEEKELPEKKEKEVYEEDEEDDEEGDDEGFTGEGPWKGRLRDRRQIHSPYKDDESPYSMFLLLLLIIYLQCFICFGTFIYIVN